MQENSSAGMMVFGGLILLIGAAGIGFKMFLNLPWGAAAVSGSGSSASTLSLLYFAPELFVVLGAGAVGMAILVGLFSLAG